MPYCEICPSKKNSPFSCTRVDLLMYGSKPTKMRRQYNWMAEKNLDGNKVLLGYTWTEQH